ncbi:MAG TPA: hypothetical protein VI756_05345 [Blastocatellia bacterium]
MGIGRYRRWWRILEAMMVALVLLPAGSVRSMTAPPKRTAEIVNTGSTNFAGYKVIVEESGHARYTPGKGRHFDTAETELEGDLRPETVRKLFADIDAAGPLSKLPPPHCMKSASFGTSTFIEVGEDRSPDLSCSSGNKIMDALYKDAQTILSELKATRPR